MEKYIEFDKVNALLTTIDLTNDLFAYMELHPEEIDFKYQRMHLPSITLYGKQHMATTRFLKTVWHLDGNSCLSLELNDMVMHSVVVEMNEKYKELESPIVKPKFYIVRLMSAGIIPNDDSTPPYCALMIRYATA